MQDGGKDTPLRILSQMAKLMQKHYILDFLRWGVPYLTNTLCQPQKTRDPALTTILHNWLHK